MSLKKKIKHAKKVQKMAYKKQKPIVYQLYQYLEKNAVGYENRIKGGVLMSELGINDHKTFRSYIEAIRDSEVLQKIICSEAGSNGGYWVATNTEEVYNTLEHLYKRSIKMLYTYSKLKKKARLNNQMRLKFGKYEKEIYKSLMEGGKWWTIIRQS